MRPIRWKDDLETAFTCRDMLKFYFSNTTPVFLTEYIGRILFPTIEESMQGFGRCLVGQQMHLSLIFISLF